jgi:hypothetical protein
MTFANFMYDIGSIKNKPAAISALFFDVPEIGGGN